jgi:hypothetical protein
LSENLRNFEKLTEWQNWMFEIPPAQFQHSYYQHYLSMNYQCTPFVPEKLSMSIFQTRVKVRLSESVRFLSRDHNANSSRKAINVPDSDGFEFSQKSRKFYGVSIPEPFVFSPIDYGGLFSKYLQIMLPAQILGTLNF